MPQPPHSLHGISIVSPPGLNIDRIALGYRSLSRGSSW
jgi:hypothetical protein